MFLPKFSYHLLPSGPGRNALFKPCSDLGLHRLLDGGFIGAQGSSRSEKTELVTYGYQSIGGAGGARTEQDSTIIAPWAFEEI